MQDERVKAIEFLDVGTMKYGACLELQHELHRKVVDGSHPGAVVLVEHEPVVTFGKNADPTFLHFSRDHLEKQGVELFDTDRGGEVTAHMPGQLVVYPILLLPELRLGARDYICLLEKTVIATLASFGVSSSTHEKYPGVWVQDRKVCAVGVRIKERATMHGIALNVCNDLELFSFMTPCGIEGKGVCRLSDLVAQGVHSGNPIGMDAVKTVFRNNLLDRLSNNFSGISAFSC